MLTIEQLKFAREIGATVHNEWSNIFKKYDEDGIKYAYIDGCWKIVDRKGLPVSGDAEIDFSPLDDHSRIDVIGQNGNDGEHYDQDDPMLAYPAPELQYDQSEVAFKPAPADMVNHPPHYQAEGVECIDAIRAALGLEGFVAYCRGNSIKYSWRAGKKDETAQDLRKAAWYLNKAAEELQK